MGHSIFKTIIQLIKLEKINVILSNGAGIGLVAFIPYIILSVNKKIILDFRHKIFCTINLYRKFL